VRLPGPAGLNETTLMEQFFFSAMNMIDLVLILPFRLMDHLLLGFFFGTICLAMGAVVLGELVISAAIRLNRGHLQALTKEVNHQEALSMQAYAIGDRASYKALNKAANDAWGRHFFPMAAYSAGMLWPVPFALAWMQWRFQGVDFALAWPLSFALGDTVGYPFIFILLYILCRIVFGKIRRWLPYFRDVQQILDGKEQPKS
jgi:hypothetical protein